LEECARAATGAAVQRHPGIAAAVFLNQPERDVYNNALLERNLANASAPTPSTRWRPHTRRPASRASPPGCTRATTRCAASSNGAALERWLESLAK
jgi:hypothetical protein